MKRLLFSLALLFSLIFSCGGIEEEPSFEDFEVEEGVEVEYREPWSSSDDPNLLDSILDDNLIFKYSSLPKQGVANKTPWPGYWWPAYKDSINFRWDGSSTTSAAKKYGQAFGVSNIEDKVSATLGIDQSQYESRPCRYESDCDRYTSMTCAKRIGDSTGYCVPTWHGICHARANASILEHEPRYPVTYNGVNFKVQDIKALTTFSYHYGLNAKTLALRCYDESVSYGSYGRPTKSRCRDSNPGSFHVVLANLLGLQKRAFVMDKSFDYQVWSYPIRKFVVESEQTLTASEANAKIGASGSTYVFNVNAKAFKYLKTAVYIIQGSPYYRDGPLLPTISNYTLKVTYYYVLELDGAGNIIGGEWVGTSKRNHPDFIWVPYRKDSTIIADIRWSNVKTLLGKSTNMPSDVEEINKNYHHTLEPGEWRDYGAFENEWGNFTATMTGPPDADLYVRKGAPPTENSWDCRPWRYNSDEVCSMSGPGTYYVAVLAYPRTTYDLNINYYGTPSAGDYEHKIVTYDHVVKKNQWIDYGKFYSDYGTFTATIDGPSPDADLYVKKGSPPTLSSWDCRPWKWHSKETCSFSSPGVYYVKVIGYPDETPYKITIDFYTGEGRTTCGDGILEGGEACDKSTLSCTDSRFGGLYTGGTAVCLPNCSGYDVSECTMEDLKHVLIKESGSVKKQTWNHYGSFNAESGGFRAQIWGPSPDADLYVRKGAPPTMDNWDCRPWRYVSNEICDFSSPGIYYVSIYGYPDVTPYDLEIEFYTSTDNPVCGDGVTEGTENCDRNTKNCSELGGTTGTANCKLDCSGYDLSTCD